MTIITGRVTQGFGAGTSNLKIQLPLIIEEFPEIKDCFLGTINLKLNKGLLVLSSDHTTRPINWHPDHAPGEIFDFLRIQLEAPEGSNPVLAWLYIPHNSPDRRDLQIHEAMTSKLAVAFDAPCKVHIPRPCIELPYREYPIVISD